MSYVADLHCGILALTLNVRPEDLVGQELAEIKSCPYQGKIVVLTKRGIWLKNTLQPLVEKMTKAAEE